MNSENAVSSHSGLTSVETVYEKKKGNLLWPIARKKNMISLRSAAFDTIFVSNLVYSHKFHVNFETAWYFLSKKTWQRPVAAFNNLILSHSSSCFLQYWST